MDLFGVLTMVGGLALFLYGMDAMGQGLPLYRATHAVHSCLLLRAGKILYRCEDLGRHNALDLSLIHISEPTRP